eukprot:408407_1
MTDRNENHQNQFRFNNSFKQLQSYRLCDKWLNKTVCITYWKDYHCAFEGIISCIASNGQIRLQNIKFDKDKHNIIAGKLFHSYWFHYKMIVSIHYFKEDITHEILDTLKQNIALSFISRNNRIKNMTIYNFTEFRQNVISNVKLMGDVEKFRYETNAIIAYLIYRKYTTYKSSNFHDNCLLKPTLRGSTFWTQSECHGWYQERKQTKWNVNELLQIILNYMTLSIKTNAIENIDECIKKTDYMDWDQMNIDIEMKMAFDNAKESKVKKKKKKNM